MELLNVGLGAACAAALPLFLVLYFLKRQYEVMPVPSTRLWRDALAQLQADRPWQRLRASLLFFLQLAAIVLLIAAALRPVGKSGAPAELIVVLDASASMQATDVQPSRFDAAKAEAVGLLDGQPAEGRFTLIVAGAQPQVAVSRSGDRLAARTRIDGLRPDYGTADMAAALALAQALRRETGGQITVLSDSWRGESAVYIGGQGANRAVERVSAAISDGRLQALSLVRSYGFSGAATVQCYADGALVDARELEMQPSEAQTVYWDNLPQGTRHLRVTLTGKDALALDDSADCVVTSGSTRKALLVTAGNVFLQAALALRDDLEVYMQAPGAPAALEGYDLYVFDGLPAEPLPADGAVLLFAPSGDAAGVQRGEALSGALANGTGPLADRLLEHVDLTQAQVAGGQAWKTDANWTVLAAQAAKTALALRENPRTVLVGFDLHDSNLPLLKEFPLLMRNLLGWALGDATGGITQATVGQSVPLSPAAQAVRVDVVLPDGHPATAAPPFPAAAFGGTTVPGIYEVRQYGADGKELPTARSAFAVTTPPGESDILATQPLPAMDGAVAVAAQGAQPWWLLAAALALLVLLVEWWVMHRVRGI